MEKTHELRRLLGPVIEAMGYELVGVEYHRRRGNDLLRVYIDSERGIALDDCQQVSGQVGALLDVEDPLPGQYTLEVSSPGLDRPLFEPEHFQRFAGQQVKLQLHQPVAGQRRWKGVLRGLQAEVVLLETEADEVLQVPLQHIEKARLVPNL